MSRDIFHFKSESNLGRLDESSVIQSNQDVVARVINPKPLLPLSSNLASPSLIFYPLPSYPTYTTYSHTFTPIKNLILSFHPLLSNCLSLDQIITHKTQIVRKSVAQPTTGVNIKMDTSKSKESSSRATRGDGGKKEKANTHKLALKGIVFVHKNVKSESDRGIRIVEDDCGICKISEGLRVIRELI
jgi:hypothetical protein